MTHVRSIANMSSILHLIQLVSAGLLAGIEVGIHYAVQPSIEVLDEVSQLRVRQALIRRLRLLVPICFLPLAVSAIATAVLSRAAPGAWCRLVTIAAVIVWLALRVVGTVPINADTLGWNAQQPPTNWKIRVDKAERFHIVGVWAVIVAFLCSVT
jgi:hypothetical protein